MSMTLADPFAVADDAVTADIAMIRVGDIGTDPRVNTRPLDQAWVDDREGVFDRRALGTLAVSRRADGSLIPVDGQHRAALVILVEGPDALVQCEVFHGLSLEKEAALFGALNDKRALTPLAKFLARRTAGDPFVNEVAQIAEDTGWRIANSGAAGVITCVGTLMSVHRNDKARKSGAKARDLEITLRSIAKAWGTRGEASASTIVAGTGAVVNLYQMAVDEERLVLALKTMGLPGVVIAEATGRRTYAKGSLKNSVSYLVTEAYRAQQKGPKIAAWKRGAIRD